MKKILFALLLLTGCGGGGSGTEDQQTVVTPGPSNPAAGTVLDTSCDVGQRPTQSPTYTHTSRVTAQGGASGLAARRAQPSSLAVSRLTVNAVKDLNRRAR